MRLPKALEQYLQDSVLAKTMGAAGKDHISGKFDVSSLVQGVESVYEEALLECNKRDRSKRSAYLTTLFCQHHPSLLIRAFVEATKSKPETGQKLPTPTLGFKRRKVAYF